MTHDEEFQAKCDEVRELVLDRAEQELFWRATHIRERDTPLIFFLKTKGKERGYFEKIETASADPANYKINQVDIDIINKLKTDAVKEYQESIAKTQDNETTNE